MSRPGCLHSNKITAQMTGPRKSLCFKERSVPTGLRHITCVIPFPVSPTGKHTVAIKIRILQIRKKTTSISLHIRFMGAEVSQVLKQRTSVKQPLTPKGYKTSVYKVVCCHQKEPEA